MQARGIISKNDWKTQPKQPDLTGSCEIRGIKYRISGWYETKGGRPHIALNFRDEDEVRTEMSQKAREALEPKFPDGGSEGSVDAEDKDNPF